MSEIRLKDYHEDKPNRVKRILWAGINKTVWRLLPSFLRNIVLRMFGARIGKSLIYRTVDVYAPWNLHVGNWACIGPRVVVYCKDMIELGDNVVVSQGAKLCTAGHDITSTTMRLSTSPIRVGSNAWVAAWSIVLPGVAIGEGAVVGAGAVVAKDVAPWTVVAGNPAKGVKERILK